MVDTVPEVAAHIVCLVLDIVVVPAAPASVSSNTSSTKHNKETTP